MTPESQYIVYSLRCGDGTYYIGRTQNLQDRLERHRKKQVAYTARRLPFSLHRHLKFQVTEGIIGNKDT